MRRFIIPATLLLAAFSSYADAQGVVPADTTASRPTALLRPANDSLFRRARRLVSEGHGVAGRALVDSLLAAADPSSSAYGDALYWHGALAPTAAAAENDYRRVIVEYPLAFYSGDALLAIAELEQARGDRAGAMQHLQRFVREHPSNPGRGIAALGVARLAFEQRDSTLACSMLAEARTSIGATDVELRNQIEYYNGRCATVAASTASTETATSTASAPSPARGASVPAVSPSSPAPRPTPSAHAATPARTTTPQRTSTPQRTTTPARTTSKPTPAPTQRASAPRMVTSYTVQVAAYDTRPDAERLVKKLATSGIKARVSGTSKPFRVRLGFYRTRQDAANEVMALKRRGIVGFVAEESHPVGTASP
jgi:cell division septation protein DedD